LGDVECAVFPSEAEDLVHSGGEEVILRLWFWSIDAGDEKHISVPRAHCDPPVGECLEGTGLEHEICGDGDFRDGIKRAFRILSAPAVADFLGMCRAEM
jgi:hypothetical protein